MEKVLFEIDFTKILVSPSENYNYLGPLSQREVLMLMDKRCDLHRKRYLACIYGKRTLSFAWRQYQVLSAQNRAKLALIKRSKLERVAV